jgi:multidrug efflux pump
MLSPKLRLESSVPPVEGLGTAGGFRVVIKDRGNSGYRYCKMRPRTIVQEATATTGLTGVSTSFRADTPWLELEVSRHDAKKLGVSMSEVFVALQVYVGSFYVNDFNRFGRTWQVNVQADARFRMKPDDVRRLKVRNEVGEMVPLGAFSKIGKKPAARFIDAI